MYLVWKNLLRQRCLVSVANGLHNELVYVIAGKWPLQLHIAKQVYCFAKIMKYNPRVVIELLAWLQ